jgi:hypothetical protein
LCSASRKACRTLGGSRSTSSLLGVEVVGKARLYICIAESSSEKPVVHAPFV